MSPAPHISPRVRAYGKARIDITRRAKDEEEWRRLWKAPSQPYPFKADEGWKFNLIYTVADYAAEIGFLIDVLGFQVLAFSPSQAQLTDLDGSFALTILAARDEGSSTPPEALRFQLNVEAISQTVRELERRGVIIDQQPTPIQAGATSQIASFRTPHGATIELLSGSPDDDSPKATEDEIGAGASAQIRADDRVKIDERATEDELLETTANAKQAVDQFVEQQQEDQPGESQASLRPHIPGGVGRLKVLKPNPGQSSKPGNGNIELTYDKLDADNVEGDDIDIDDEYP
jgi:hypothetical protein